MKLIKEPNGKITINTSEENEWSESESKCIKLKYRVRVLFWLQGWCQALVPMSHRSRCAKLAVRDNRTIDETWLSCGSTQNIVLALANESGGGLGFRVVVVFRATRWDADAGSFGGSGHQILFYCVCSLGWDGSGGRLRQNEAYWDWCITHTLTLTLIQHYNTDHF